MPRSPLMTGAFGPAAICIGSRDNRRLMARLPVAPVGRMPAYVDDRDDIEKSVDQKGRFGQLLQPFPIEYCRKNPCGQQAESQNRIEQEEQVIHRQAILFEAAQVFQKQKLAHKIRRIYARPHGKDILILCKSKP